MGEMDLHSPIGLIAGSGILPIHFAKSAKDRGLAVVCLAHRGESDPRVQEYSDELVWVKVGQLGKIIKTLRKSGCREVALAGGLSKIKILGGIKLDLRGAALVGRVRSIRDDVILRGIAEEIEKEGIRVISATALLGEFVPMRGTLTKKQLSKSALQDALFGWQTAKLLGRSDTGQTAVIKGGVVVALETVEGTDATITRGTELGGAGAVVVKVSKPQQDLRLDLPSIGAKTIEFLVAGKAKGLVLEAGKTLILSQEEVVAQADAAGLAIEIFEDEIQIEEQIKLR